MDSRICKTSEHERCQPLKTLEDVSMWRPSVERKHSTYELHERIINPNIPKSLVCHDMKGGYLEDSYLNGVKMDNPYFFVHWSMVDVFVYFSHHFVTIPPCGWISAAHKNGTKILGTFITEWDDGASICEEFLVDKKSIEDLSTQLVHIAVFYDFDGWLINIENKLQRHQVALLQEFIEMLTKKMHQEKTSSLVIWYDSVIESGELKWQNGLNERNRDFFDICDGIFLNYNWDTETLKRSLEVAHPRKTDVYVGVDVFGRGCLGGGGFCTDIAVRVAREHGLSVAIFAPGWVHECLDAKDFVENQYKFWDALAELCPLQTVKCSSYSSSFCPGFGKKMYRKGKAISGEAWYNMGLQAPQPSYHYNQCCSSGCCISLFVDDAYDGGGCLKFSNTFGDKDNLSFKFLSTHIPLKKSYLISYTFKSVLDPSCFTIQLSVKSFNASYVVNLVDSNYQPQSELEPLDLLSIYEYPVEENITKKLNLESCENGWRTRCYILEKNKYLNNIVDKVTAKIYSSHTPKNVLLGKLQILPYDEENVLKISDFSIVKPITEKMYINCSLEWVHVPSVDNWDIFYKINEHKVYINTTCQSYYEIKNLELQHTNATAGSVIVVRFMLCPQRKGIDMGESVTAETCCLLSPDYFV